MELKPSEAKFLYKVNPRKIKEYEEKAMYFSKPQLVTCFDYNHGRFTKAKRMNYLKVPRSYQYPIDINANLETYIPRNPIMNKGFEASLKYEMLSGSSSDCENIVDKTKVITRRGALVHLMEIYYKKQFEKDHVRVSRYNNNLYIIVEKCNEYPSELKPVHTHHQRFAQMMFVDSPDGTLNTTDTCDENVMLVGVHRSSFEEYVVIYSGEIQGIMGDEIIKNFDDMDEISDRRFVLTKQMWKTLKNKDQKYLNFWLQSYLGNVRDIFIGYKNSSGIIDEPIEHVLVKDLPKKSFWKPSICTGFLHDFLQNVEKVMSAVNCLNTVFEFEFNQKTQCFTYKVFRGKTEKSFISEDYQKFCSSL